MWLNLYRHHEIPIEQEDSENRRLIVSWRGPECFGNGSIDDEGEPKEEPDLPPRSSAASITSMDELRDHVARHWSRTSVAKEIDAMDYLAIGSIIIAWVLLLACMWLYRELSQSKMREREYCSMLDRASDRYWRLYQEQNPSRPAVD